MHQTVVLDNGSWNTKSGFAGDEEPRCWTPSVVVHGKSSAAAQGVKPMRPGAAWVGDEALERFATAGTSKNCGAPMHRGRFNDWNALEALWCEILHNELRVDPGERTLLVTEPMNTPKGDREKLTNMAFETFECPAFYLALQTTLALYATGRTTGCVIDAGHGAATFGAIYEGYLMPDETVVCQALGGDNVIDHLFDELNNKPGVALDKNNWNHRRLVADIKERTCCVPMPLRTEPRGKPQTFKMPDGHTIELGDECYRMGEALFSPAATLHLASSSSSPSPSSTSASFNFTEMLLKATHVTIEGERLRDFARNTVVVGSGSKMNGFVDRLLWCRNHHGDQPTSAFLSNQPTQPTKIMPAAYVQQLLDDPSLMFHHACVADIRQLIFSYVRDDKDKKKIDSESNTWLEVPKEGGLVVPRDRAWSAWLGGSVLGSLSTMNSMFISLSEYNESGSDIVHRRCF